MGCMREATRLPQDFPPPSDDDDGNESISSVSAGFTLGIMTCLPVGTAVDVSIIHIPTSKPIYTKTVYVQ